jgi:hypothetical protein
VNPGGIGNPISEGVAIIDSIINLGERIWKIVAAGRPVMNVRTAYANAMPRGVKCWADLEGWKVPYSKVYKTEYKNGFDATVISFAYRVNYGYGGNVEGKGAYIANATIALADVSVAWGYTFNVIVNVPNVMNVGTRDNPVAGMQMDVQWQVDTAIKHSESQQSYFINGNGVTTKLD